MTEINLPQLYVPLYTQHIGSNNNTTAVGNLFI